MSELTDRVIDRRIEVALPVARGHAPDLTGRILDRLHREPQRPPRERSFAAAAIVLLGVGVTIGIAIGHATRQPVPASQDPAPREVRSEQDVRGLDAGTRKVIGIELGDRAVAALSRLASLEQLELRWKPEGEKSAEPDAAELAELGELSRLQRLEMSGLELPAPNRLEWLERLPLLTELRIVDATGWTDRHFDALRRVQSLQLLDVEGWGELSDVALATVGQLPGLVELRLAGAFDFSPEGFAHLAKLRRLRSLDLSIPARTTRPRTRAAGIVSVGGAGPLRVVPPRTEDSGTDALLRSIAKLDGLRELSLRFRKDLTDAGLEALAKLDLVALDLNAIRTITDKGLAHLPPTLERLGLRACQGVGAEFPRHLRALRELDLANNPNVDDSLAEWLGSLPHLEWLDLGTCPELTPKAAGYLAKARTLRHLSLRGTNVMTDESLEQLAELTELRHLNVRGFDFEFRIPGSDVPVGGRSTVTERGIRALRKLTELESLGLGATQPLPVACLRDLGGLPLTQLEIKAITIRYDETTRDLDALRAIWPNANVEWASPRH